MMKNQPNFVAYSVGICYASVCTELSLKEATARLNCEQPTGLDHGWHIADEPFGSGESNPCPCNTHPETHKHYLFAC